MEKHRYDIGIYKELLPNATIHYNFEIAKETSEESQAENSLVAENKTDSNTNTTVSAAEIYGDFEYNVLDDGTVEITKYTGSSETIDIPNEINGRKVKQISSLFPDGCENLTSINIPESVEIIYLYFVYDCPNLMEINVDKNNSKYVSLDGVLFNKSKTRIIAYPQGRQGEYRIPDSVKEISGMIFDHCHGLTKIYIPLSVRELYAYAISNCDNLTDIYYEGSGKRLKNILYYPNIPCGNDKFYDDNTNYFSSYYSYQVNIHYNYRMFGVVITLSCVVLTFLLIWLYGRKLRKECKDRRTYDE